MEAWEYDLLKKEENERVDEDTLSEAAEEGLDLLTSFIMDSMKEAGFTPSELGAWLAIRGDFTFIKKNFKEIEEGIKEGWHYAINEARDFYNSNNIYEDEIIEGDELFKNEILEQLNKKLEIWDSLGDENENR